MLLSGRKRDVLQSIPPADNLISIDKDEPIQDNL